MLARPLTASAFVLAAAVAISLAAGVSVASPPALEARASLRARLVECRASAAMLAVTLRDQHPSLAATRARAARLEAAVTALGEPSKAEDRATRRRVQRRRGDLQRQLETLLTRYRDKHPRVRALRAGLAAMDADTKPSASNAPMPSDERYARLVVQRAEVRGIRRFLKRFYGPKYPRRQASDVTLAKLRIALDAMGAPGPARRRGALRALDYAMERARARRAALPDDKPAPRQALELDFVIDALALAGARIGTP